MGWADNIKKRGNAMLDWVDEKTTDVAEKFFITIVDYSPTTFVGADYAKGVFVNSWYPAVNNFDPTVGGAPDMSGTGSRQRISALRGSKAFFRQDGFVSLSNNLHYAYRVEFAGWPLGEGGKWNWTGTVGPYAPVRKAMVMMKGITKQ